MSYDWNTRSFMSSMLKIPIHAYDHMRFIFMGVRSSWHKGPKHRRQFAANWEARSILSTSNSFSRSRVIIFLYAAMAELRGLRQRRGFYISCEWDGTLARGPVTCIGYWPGWILSKSLGDCFHQESRQGLEQSVVWLLNSTSTLYGACVTTSG